MIQRDDPIYLTYYDCGHDLLDNPGWKQLRQYFKKTKKMNRLLKSTKAEQRRNAVEIELGMNNPCSHK